MALASGSGLGSYEILAPLGAGGMGEVFRARDLKLSREVALKVLPTEFALDANGSRVSNVKRSSSPRCAWRIANFLSILEFAMHIRLATAIHRLRRRCHARAGVETI
jgi:serine/threonine protein kinase